MPFFRNTPTSFSRRRFLQSSAALVASSALVPRQSLAWAKKEMGIESLLHEVQRRVCRFFQENSGQFTGLVKDRALHSRLDRHIESSIAATGFGLSALCIAASNGFMPTAEAQKRAQVTLEYVAKRLPHERGFFYHFVDMNTGDRIWKCEASSIDTTLLLCGVLHARAFFDSKMIRQLAADIYERVDWKWMLNGGPTLSHGWKPESGFLPSRWDVYCELMGMYLLAIGSPTFPIPAKSWEAWKRPAFDYEGLRYLGSPAPLFVHQYAHAWIDFRNKRDTHADYFENSVTATLAHQRFCVGLKSKYPWMSDQLWGISASDSEKGYQVWGGPPKMGNIDGTIVPSAAGGAIAFLPESCKQVLHFVYENYPNAWSPYGFVDAFHPKHKWYDPEVLGIDLGITLLMVENMRNGGVWNSFMSNPEIGAAMRKVGFTGSEVRFGK